jgi:hypothetical protein
LGLTHYEKRSKTIRAGKTNRFIEVVNSFVV